MNSSPQHQSGVTLIEVLIAVLVLSIGLLGMATLQFKGLRFGQQSYQQSQAALLAQELTDIMRTSRDEAIKGSYNISTAPAAPSVDCISSSCSASQLVAYDRYDWYTRVANRLPSGKAIVACSGGCGAGAPHSITIQWDENRSGSADSSYVLRFAL